MTITEKKTLTCTCNKCKYVWHTRTEKIPKACPNCKSMRWNEEIRKKLDKKI